MHFWLGQREKVPNSFNAWNNAKLFAVSGSGFSVENESGAEEQPEGSGTVRRGPRVGRQRWCHGAGPLQSTLAGSARHKHEHRRAGRKHSTASGTSRRVAEERSGSEAVIGKRRKHWILQVRRWRQRSHKACHRADRPNVYWTAVSARAETTNHHAF